MKNFIKKYVDGNTLYLALLGINAIFPGVVPDDLVDADACSALVEGTGLMARLFDEGCLFCPHTPKGTINRPL